VKIALLAWGSLIYDRGNLALAEDWKLGGPELPIEFSRISKTGDRMGCLTLVIDEANGAVVPTRFALSARSVLADAIMDLQTRERTHKKWIGFLDFTNELLSLRAFQLHPIACERIRLWAKQRKFDAAIWTALPSNFQDKTGQPFSVHAGMDYLENLYYTTRAKALDYIRQAPPEVITPLRRRLVESKIVEEARA